MIRLGHRPPAPDYLEGPTVSEKKAELENRINAGENLSSTDFPSYWLNEDVREPLWQLHLGKCCYCERKRAIRRESDIEHYRPKTMVTGENDHPGYWWLAYDWTNYLFSCKPCNQTHKKNHFPLLPGSIRASGPSNDVGMERPVLLNPIDDDPERCISYDWTSKIYVKALGADDDNRGSETIKILGLNDPHLMEERAEILSLLRNLAHTMIHMLHKNNMAMIEKCTADILGQTSAKKPFAGFRRAYFRSLGLEEYVADD